MGTRYTTNSAASFNAAPPSDDGATTESNKVTWAKIKTKLADPVKTLADDINSDIVTALDTSCRSVTGADSAAASDHWRTIQVTSASAFITLPDAATMATGYIVSVANQSASTITVGLATATNLIDTVTNATVSIPTKSARTYIVNTAANGYITLGESGGMSTGNNHLGAQTFSSIAFTTVGVVSYASNIAFVPVGSGGFFIRENSNTFSTNGLTINQEAADDECISLKSSDIAHGITDNAETDTYGTLAKDSATAGGVLAVGYSEGTRGFRINGVHTTDDTTKSTAGNGAVEIRGVIKSGTGTAGLGADANILCVRTGTTTRFIFDAEGSFHADVESTTFDKFDDLALLEAFDLEFQRRNGDPIKEEFGEILRENKATLQREGIVNYYDETGKRAMVNMTKLSMLLTGAVRQLGKRLAVAERKVALLPE